jgi:hypothetical protein
MAKKKEETVEIIVEAPVVVEETVETVEVDKCPGHKTRAFRG